MLKNLRYKRLYSLEKGRIGKPFGLQCNIALVFPDCYEPAMSNLGFHTVYRYLNSHPEINCERFFFEKKLSFSFENQRKLKEFDVVAFSLPFEPGYLQAMQFLKHHGLHIDNKKRGSSDPLIIAGGTATSINAKPLDGCVDFIISGDLENTGETLVQCLLEGFDKKSRLEKLNEAFSLHPHYRDDNNTNTCIPRHSQIITPCTTLKNKLLIEVTRGCPYRCTFCFIGNQGSSFRQSTWEDVRNIMTINNSKNLGIISSAVGSWKGLQCLIPYARHNNYQVSFSSLRIDEVNDSIIDMLLFSGQQSLTLAPETADEKIRFSLNKNIVNEKIFSIVEKAFYKGLQQVKLYFMVGVPGESKASLVKNMRFFQILDTLVKESSRKTKRAKRLIVKIGIFVPKPFTPLAQTPLLPEATLTDLFTFYKESEKKYTSLTFAYDSVRSYNLQYLLSNFPGSLRTFFEAWCSGEMSQKKLINDYLGRISHV